MWGCAPSPFGYWSGMLWLVLAVAVAALLPGLRRGLRNRDGSRADREDSLRILRLRLAKGEISPEEYRRMREILKD